MNNWIKSFFKEILYILIPNKLFVKIKYYQVFRKKLNFDNLKTFTEKMQYFKLYQIEKIYSDLADKYKVRDYVKEKIWEDVLIKLHWVWENIEDIPFKDLPNSYIIKCNHGCKYNIIVENKNKLNINDTINKLTNWMNEDYYKWWREMQYKNIDKKILIEELLVDEKTNFPIDYKFLCFNWEPELIQLSLEKNIDVKLDIYDINWNKQNICYVGYNNTSYIISKPKNIDKMIEYSKILSKWFKFARIDLYEVNEKIYFWEITFTPWSWYAKFYPNHDDIDKLLWDKIIL